MTNIKDNTSYYEANGVVVVPDGTVLTPGLTVRPPLTVDEQIKAHRLRAAEADADLARTLAEAASLAHSKDTLRWAYERAGDNDARVLRFAATIDLSSAHEAIDTLSRWDRLDALKEGDVRPYSIYITSGGGSIMPGISLHAFLRKLSARRPVITVASGFVASMATIIHQAGSIRQIERASSYLIHDASSQAFGNVHDLNDQAAWISRINDDLHEILAERSTLTVDEIAERSKRRDWTLTAEQAVELGFADEVV